ncbi:MAG: undecaprenyl/decaprenyl-phosphate alpha-N-acetylglucosaminyl 1-phosphate transferase [Deinococcus sp.]|nr:undecaprenyl/decaprenyl-phosphate alpha-N-acetylglucosaminyl 1-phosphate transferase [Deinococcus sp.]
MTSWELALAATLGFLVAMTAVILVAPTVRKFALRVGAVDRPNERRQNREPVPNLGGIAIFLGFLLAVLLVTALWGDKLGWWQDGSRNRSVILATVLGGIIMTLTGLLDDILDLPPGPRLIVQALAALIVIVAVPSIEIPFINPGGVLPLALERPYLQVLVTLLWLMGVTNALNYVDGLDGLASGITFIAAGVLSAVAWHLGSREAEIIILLCLAGAALGFLRHNAFPARIFMGDNGSTLLGFVLAAVSILGTLKQATVIGLIIPVLVLGLPIMDITTVTFRRVLRRMSPAKAGRDHFHHRLIARGWGQRRTVFVLWSVGLALGTVALIVDGLPLLQIAAVMSTLVFFLGATYLARTREDGWAPRAAVAVVALALVCAVGLTALALVTRAGFQPPVEAP